jgi:hypothetical protein
MNEIGSSIKKLRQLEASRANAQKETTTSASSNATSKKGSKGSATKKGVKSSKKATAASQKARAAAAANAEEDDGEEGDAPSMFSSLKDSVVAGGYLLVAGALENRGYLLFALSTAGIFFFGDYASV